MKIPMTPAGIEPATFRIVAQHLNHCATAVPMTLCNTSSFFTRSVQLIFSALNQRRILKILQPFLLYFPK